MKADRGGYSVREQLPLPTKPPYTVHLGNMSFDATEGDISDFFTGCQVTSVRIVEDKLASKPKGFGYVEFATLDGLKKALDANNTQFQGRSIRVSVAEPRKSHGAGTAFRDMLANHLYAIQRKTDLMLENLVTGHEKALSQMPQVSAEDQIEAVSPLDVEGSTMPQTLEVKEVIGLAVDLVMNRAMARYETLETGIAKVHLRRLYQQDQRLEVSIVQ